MPTVWQWARWSLEVLGHGKSFRHNRVLGDPELNRRGLHAARLRLAAMAVRARRAQLAPFVPERFRRALDADGFVKVHPFLPPALFERVEREARAYRGPVRQSHQGDTLTHRVLLDRATRRRMPAIAEAVHDPRWAALMRYAAGSLTPPLFYVHRVLNQSAPGAVDPQKHLHADTFHATAKAWLFLDEVREDAGPFCYVRGSHRLDPERLAWERERSISAGGSADRYTGNGSLRLTEEDRARLGYDPPVRFAVPPNTLVVADTHGFHARGASNGPSSRLALWAYLRPHPFAPLALPPPPGTADIQEAALQWWWDREDARAAAHGHVSAWHPVEAAFSEPTTPSRVTRA